MEAHIEFPAHPPTINLDAADRRMFQVIVGSTYRSHAYVMRMVAHYADAGDPTTVSRLTRYCARVHKLAALLSKYGQTAALKIAHNLLCNRHDLVIAFYLGMESEADVRACQTYEFRI